MRGQVQRKGGGGIAKTAEKRSEPLQKTQGCLVVASIPLCKAFRRGAEPKHEKLRRLGGDAQTQKKKKVPSSKAVCVAIPALLAGAPWHAGEREEDEEASKR